MSSSQYYKVTAYASVPQRHEVEVTLPLAGPQGPAGPAGSGLETLTTLGDTLYRGASTGERLPIGAAGQILKVSAGGIPEWGAAPSSGVTSVTGAAPIVSSGGATPAISVTVGTGANTVAAGDDSRFHTRSHAMTGTSDHTASNWSVFYSNGSGQVTELGLGSANTVLTSNGASSAPTFAAAASGGTKTYAFWSASSGNQPPSSGFMTLDTRNSIAVLDADDATTESAIFVGVMPEAASLASGLIVRIHFMATSATSGNVRWSVSFERGNTDLDSDNFDSATAATTATSGTSGIPAVSAITCTSIDSITAGDPYRLRIQRLGADAADTMTGDAEIYAVELRSAA